MIVPSGINRLVQPANRLRDDAASAAFPFGLAAEGVHEIAEASYGDAGAVAGFALSALAKSRPGIWLWIRERVIGLDQGRLTGLGAAAFGLDPARFLFVETGSALEALMATEEGLRSSAVAAVVTEVRDTDFTASRRLVLAGDAGHTPALLLLPYTREGATAAHARWRVSPAPSAANPFDPRAPGRPRWRAVLERSRLAPGQAGRQFDLEFDDETLCQRLVPGLADRPAPARPAQPGRILPFRKAG